MVWLFFFLFNRISADPVVSTYQTTVTTQVPSKVIISTGVTAPISASNSVEQIFNADLYSGCLSLTFTDHFCIHDASSWHNVYFSLDSQNLVESTVVQTVTTTIAPPPAAAVLSSPTASPGNVSTPATSSTHAPSTAQAPPAAPDNAPPLTISSTAAPLVASATTFTSDSDITSSQEMGAASAGPSPNQNQNQVLTVTSAITASGEAEAEPDTSVESGASRYV